MPTNTHMFSYPRGNERDSVVCGVGTGGGGSAGAERGGRKEGELREGGWGVHSVGRKVAKARVLKRNLG